MLDLLRDNASALFALLGAFGAAVVSFLAGWLLRKRDYDLRLWDKLVERRIDAHERLLDLAFEMQVMVAFGGREPGGEVARAPEVLLSKQDFANWHARAVRSGLASSPWLSLAAKHEANFMQDYLVTLLQSLESVPEDKYLAIGSIIRQDFIDISSALQRAAFSFFEADIRRLRLPDLRNWHKYPRERTEQRLRETRLFTRWAEVKKLAEA